MCGQGGRSDQALKLVYAMRKDGMEPDPTCWTAYSNGKALRIAQAEADAANPSLKKPVQLRLPAPALAYERLLQLECSPAAAAEAAPSVLGQITKIRIQW